MKLLIGIGNELKGDDSIGVFIAKNFKAKNWKTIEAGTVPENFIGVVHREKPELLVLVDAADMGLPAGEIRRIPPKKAGSAFYCTHSLPLRQFIEITKKNTHKTILIGIQPKSTKFGEKASIEAKKAAKKIMQLLKEEKIEKIKML